MEQNTVQKFDLKFDGERPYIFVSYKSDDKEIVENNIRYLQEHYGLNIWYDADLTLGFNWDEEALPKLIDENCQLLLFFASEEALCSSNVKKELDMAKFFKKIIVPINFSNSSFDDVMRDDIARKYSKIDMPKVQNALKIIQEHLNEQRTYIYLHKSNYYEELIKSIKRITEKCDQNVFIHKTSNSAPKVVASTISEIPSTLEEDLIVNNKKVDNAVKVEKANTSEKTVKKEIVNKKEAEIKPKEHVIKPKNNLIVYKLYGQEYSGNQADLMYNVFDKVIERHSNKLDEIVKNLNSVSFVDYENKNNVDGNMKTQFRICKTLKANGRSYCVGASLNKNAKFSQISKLLNICGEDPSVLEIYEHDLPNIKTKEVKQRENISTSGNLIDFTLYGDDYKGNQSDMMLKIFEKVITNHPDKIKLLHEKLTAVSLVDKNDIVMKGQSSTFNTKRIFEVNGKKVCVGTNFGISAKLSQISKLLNLCDEEQSIIQIEGYNLPKGR